LAIGLARLPLRRSPALACRGGCAPASARTPHPGFSLWAKAGRVALALFTRAWARKIKFFGNPIFWETSNSQSDFFTKVVLMRATKLADVLLQDRKRRQDNNKPKSTTRQRIEGGSFDPFSHTRWRVLAAGEKPPGYLPKTPMRMGPAGWFVSCWHCMAEFESR